MPFTLIYDKPGEPTIYLCSDDDIAGTDEEINAALPGVPPGTMISTAGFATIRQLGVDGSWSTDADEGGS